MIIIIYEQGVQTPVDVPDSDLPLWALVEICRDYATTSATIAPTTAIRISPTIP